MYAHPYGLHTGTVDTDYLFDHAADMVHAADMYQLRESINNELMEVVLFYHMKLAAYKMKQFMNALCNVQILGS